MHRLAQTLIAVAVAVGLSRTATAADPETVMITLHARRGAEQALEGVLARHYETARRLGLVSAGSRHLTLRSAAKTRGVDFVEILSWRDADVPDNAPREIEALWREMNALVEPRAGRPAIDIVTMIPVAATR